MRFEGRNVIPSQWFAVPQRNVLIISDGAQQLDAGGELENDESLVAIFGRWPTASRWRV
jgi:hypothetical protein